MADQKRLEDTLAQLPVFQGRKPEIKPAKQQASATECYLVTWNGSQAVLKLYGEPEDASPLVRAKYRAAAEAEGLRLFAPKGLAPELIWQGALTGGNGQQAALISAVPGELIGTRALSYEQISTIVSALKEIHAEKSERRLVSSTPRNLEAWWARAHEAYRELPGAVVSSMPESAREVLDSVVHLVAADTQAHRRYWQVSPLTPVQGSPGLNNVRLGGDRPIFIDWECFGMGDLSLEIATWAGLIGLWSGAEAKDRFLTDYLAGNEDEMLPARIAIYRRFWAFGYVLPLLANAQAGRTRGNYHLTKDDALTIIECFTWLMTEYERPSGEIEKVRASLSEWLRVGEG